MWTGRGLNKFSDAKSAGPLASNRHARPSLTSEYVAACNEIEQVILNVWQEILGIDQLGIQDNFFDLGGNSLVGLKVISRLKKELNLEIPLVALFEGPTVSALARVVSKDRSEAPAGEESRGRGERRRERLRVKQRVSDELETGSIA